MFGVNTGPVTGPQILMIVSSALLFGITLYYNKRRRTRADNEKPKEWRKIGVLSDLQCYPIKSCGVIKLEEAECVTLGLKSGMLRDRVFMVVDQHGSFITGRIIPKLTQVMPTIQGSVLTLKGSGMPDISMDIKKISTSATAMTRVWGQLVSTIDCGDDVANWLAKFLVQGEERVVRLVFYPSDAPSRTVRPKNTTFDKCTSKDTGALPDATSFNLLTESSLRDLNTRLQEPVTMESFRGNFIVSGSEAAYAEDTWDWVRIGTATFRNVKPCTRCLFTTVNPITGEKSLDQEPLKTLKTYRKITDPELIPSVGDSPVFGIHLALREAGRVSVGDSVYVG